MTIAKGADFSKWDGGADHDKTLNWGAYTWNFAFIKVSEGTVIDPLFRAQWVAAKGHTLRGAYHFFHPFLDPKDSVQKTIGFLNGDLGELPMMFDLEETDGRSAMDILARAKSWLAWYEQLTDVRPMVYSSPYFLTEVLKAGTATWLSNYKLVLAQYPYDKWSPDNVRDQIIHAILTGVRDIVFPNPPAPFKKVTFLQWTAKGKPEDVPGYYMGYGHKLAVDFISYNGEFRDLITEFYITDDPSPEPVPLPTQQEYQSIRRFESSCYVLIVDPLERRIHVTNTGGKLETVSSAAKRMGAKYAINGDGWWSTPPYLPLSLAASDGKVYQNTQYEIRPFLNISKAGAADIRIVGTNDLFNTVSGTRILVSNGVRPSYLFGSESQFTQKHPRTAVGIRGDGKLVFVVVDGRSETDSGVTLVDLASILLEFGCVEGMELDGGGSSEMVVDGQIVNVPSDGHERPVVNHILVGATATSTSTGGATVTTYSGKTTTDAKVWSAIGGTQINTIKSGTSIKGDGISGDYFHLTAPVVGWTKRIWLSYMADVVTLPPEPTPTGPTLTHTIEVYSDGTLKVDGNSIP